MKSLPKHDAYRISDECYLEAIRLFAAHGITQPTSCELAWFARHSEGSLAKDLTARRANRNAATRRSPMDILGSHELEAGICWVMTEQKVPQENREALFKRVTGKPPPQISLDSIGCIGCESMMELCIPWECHVYHEKHPTGGPSLSDFQKENRDALKEKCDALQASLSHGVSNGHIELVQVPMVGGKTYQLAGLALTLLREGQPFYAIVDNADTAENFFEQLRKHLVAAQNDGATREPRRIVFALGRQTGECQEPTQQCWNCQHWMAVRNLKNDLLAQVGTYNGSGIQVLDRDAIQYLAKKLGGLCCHAISSKVVEKADGIVMAQNYVLDPSLRDARPRLRAVPDNQGRQALLWDECDTMLDTLTGLATRELAILTCRSRGGTVFDRGKICHGECENCRIAQSSQDVLQLVEAGMEVFLGMAGKINGAESVLLLDEIRWNIEALRDFMGRRFDGTGSPREKIKRFLDVPELGPLDLYDLNFRPTVDQRHENGLRKAALALKCKNHLTEGDVRLLFHPQCKVPGFRHLGDEHRRCLEGFLEFADVSNGSESRIEMTTRASRLPYGVTPCSVYVRRFDHRLAAEAIKFIGSRKSILMSGTIVNGELFAEQMGIARRPTKYSPLGSKQMHSSVIFLIWSHAMGAAFLRDQANPCVPMKLSPDELLTMINDLSVVSVECKNVLIFADNIREAKRIVGHGDNPSKHFRAYQVDRLDVQLQEHRKDEEDQTEKVRVDVSYQRSSISRGSEHTKYQLAILYGNGMQNGADYRLLAATRQGQDDPEGLARALNQYGRLRAVAQAAARIPRDDKQRRIVMLVGKIGPYDIPDYMRNRLVYANEIFESKAGAHPDKMTKEVKLEWQIKTVKMWMASWIDSRPDSPDLIPSREGRLRDYHPSVKLDVQQFERLKQDRGESLRRVFEILSKKGYVQPTGEASDPSISDWSAFVKSLTELGILSRDRKNMEGGRHRLEPGAYFDALQKYCTHDANSNA